MPHAFHVKNCPLPEIITKQSHLGKYFLKEPEMGKFVASNIQSIEWYRL